MLQTTKLKGDGDLKNTDFRHGDAELGLALLGLDLALVTGANAPLPPFWNGSVYSVPLCVGSM